VTSPASLAERIAQVQAQIAEACQRAGRDPQTVTLVAVSKTHPAESVLEAMQAGMQDFGENRVEEASEKITTVNGQVKEPPVWHLIGHLQSRKARDLFSDDGQPLFDLVHSVDSVKLAGKLSKLAEDHGTQLDILLQMNVSGEASKEGFDAVGWDQNGEIRARLWQDFSTIRSMPGLSISGLMTIAPIVDEVEQARPIFRDLRLLRDALSESFGAVLTDLSMGMTDDYPIAIEEGATLVRVGRAIFGERG
jgi:pyridoxal phosphate enzyme (YggS family)